MPLSRNFAASKPFSILKDRYRYLDVLFHRKSQIWRFFVSRRTPRPSGASKESVHQRSLSVLEGNAGTPRFSNC
jgi:hypothetical protein